MALPPEAYTAQDWFDREQWSIFERTWQFAGFVEDLAEPGAFRAVPVGRLNIAVVRHGDGDLRAFHNVCRHRGAQLLRASGRGDAIVCPYHLWRYDLDGQLDHVPMQGEEFPNLDKKKFCLKRAGVGVWRGMVFVHPDPDAEPVETFFAPMDAHMGPYRPDELPEFELARTSTVVRANWKVIVENWIDVYHLSQLHSDTLYIGDHANAEFAWHGPHWTFREPLTAEYADGIENRSPLPLLPGFDTSNPVVRAPMLYPNLGVFEGESSWSTFHVVPVSPTESRIETRTRIAPASIPARALQAAKSLWNAPRRPARKHVQQHPSDPIGSGNFIAEDNYVCEQQQRGFESPMFEQGPMARHAEGPVREFRKRIRARVAEA